LDDFGIEDQSMQPKLQHWIWMTLAVLALGNYLPRHAACSDQASYCTAELGLKAKGK
jgi:hypothetical protein